MFIYILIVIAGVPLSLQSCCWLLKGQRPVGKLNLNTGINLFQHTHKAIGYFYSALYWVIFFNQKERNTRVLAPY